MNNKLRNIIESNIKLEKRYLVEEEGVESNALSTVLKTKLKLDDSATENLDYDKLTQECKTFLEKKTSVTEQDFPACAASLVVKLTVPQFLELLKNYQTVSADLMAQMTKQ